MLFPTHSEYRRAMFLLRVCYDELAELEIVLCALCIVGFLKQSGPWTDFQSRQLVETFNHVTG